MSIQIIRHCDLTLVDARQIAQLKMQFWPYDMGAQLKWLAEETERDDEHYLLHKDGRLVGYLRCTRRITSNETPLVGVSTVVAHKERHGTGCGRTLMMAANANILQAAHLGVLCCLEANVPFYQKCGWNVSKKCFKRLDDTQFFREDNVMTLGDDEQLPEIVSIDGRAF